MAWLSACYALLWFIVFFAPPTYEVASLFSSWVSSLAGLQEVWIALRDPCTWLGMVDWLTRLVIARSSPLFATLAGGIVAYAFYLAAVEAASNYGRLIQSSIDVYRFRLLSEMKLPMPRNLIFERQLWQRVARLIIYGDDGSISYELK
jgi:hypothetical protein